MGTWSMSTILTARRLPRTNQSMRLGCRTAGIRQYPATLHSRHRRNPERPVNRSHDFETKISNLVNNFTHQPKKCVRKKLCFQ